MPGAIPAGGLSGYASNEDGVRVASVLTQEAWNARPSKSFVTEGEKAARLHTAEELMTVLLVDDAVFYRARLRSFLRTRLPLVEIIGETGGREGVLPLVLMAQPDVVMLDIQLAGGGGFELLRQLKDCAHPPIVIVLTYVGERDCHASCLEAGADFFFDKRFDLEILEAVLRNVRRPSRCRMGEDFPMAGGADRRDSAFGRDCAESRAS